MFCIYLSQSFFSALSFNLEQTANSINHEALDGVDWLFLKIMIDMAIPL